MSTISTSASGKKRGHEDYEMSIDHENRENGSYEDDDDHDDEDRNNDDEDDDFNYHNSGKKKKTKKKKKNRPTRIMSESGQTDADRRLLRRRQRELHNDIAVGGGGVGGEVIDHQEVKEGGADELNRLRQQNNDLWRDVRFTREAVLDSENVELIASKAARQAEKLVQVPRYDAVRVAQALVKKGAVRTGSSTRQFNWRGLGFQVGVCFNALPSHVSFLYGPLDAEYIPKERKERQQRRKTTQSDDEEEEQPEDVDQVGKKKESDGNELSAVQKHIKVINATLKQQESEARAMAIAKSEEYVAQLKKKREDQTIILKKKSKFLKENSQVPAVNCLFNPKSFTQTVENIFHFSFLVKDSLAGIKARSVDDAREFGGVPGPVIRPENNRDGNLSAPTQAIVSLNMKDWRDMCKAYNVEESHVPHRVDGKVAKKEKGRKSN